MPVPFPMPQFPSITIRGGKVGKLKRFKLVVYGAECMPGIVVVVVVVTVAVVASSSFVDGATGTYGLPPVAITALRK